MNKKNQKGFTLVELIVVIAIVAILAAVGIVGYTQFINNARKSNAQSELDQVVNIIRADAIVEPQVIGEGGVKVTGGQLEFYGTFSNDQLQSFLEKYLEGDTPVKNTNFSIVKPDESSEYVLSYTNGEATVTVKIVNGAGLNVS